MKVIPNGPLGPGEVFLGSSRLVLSLEVSNALECGPRNARDDRNYETLPIVRKPIHAPNHTAPRVNAKLNVRHEVG